MHLRFHFLKALGRRAFAIHFDAFIQEMHTSKEADPELGCSKLYFTFKLLPGCLIHLMLL